MLPAARTALAEGKALCLEYVLALIMRSRGFQALLHVYLLEEIITSRKESPNP